MNKPSWHLFRDKYKNVVFIFISDDMEWGRQNLGVRNKHGDLYFAGEGDGILKSRYARKLGPGLLFRFLSSSFL